MPSKFNGSEISFEYPENWTLEEQDAPGGVRSVTVTAPSGAFWSVGLHPALSDPMALARAAADALVDEYRQVEVDRASETIAAVEMVGYDLGFYCLDLIGSARVRCFWTARATYSIFCQAEDREFERLEDVFAAMTVSFLRNLPEATEEA